MNELTDMQRIAVWILPVIFAITVHEVAHGWVAKKKGDTTAYMLGRLTLNPLKHIDLVGTILLPGILILTGTGMIFGWAKPVPVNPKHFKNPKKDMALVAIAGPVSNFLMALGWALIIKLAIALNMEMVSLPLIYSGIAGISINLVLGLLNLIPIPPLDGSRIITAILPDKLAYQYNRFERYGFLVLMALLYANVLGSILGVPMSYAQKFFFSIAGL
ncbi:MAG: site-2 protease family protein [Methylococcales bacterium]|nr:site-2 protease family protein [Methylococcales bacterium]